MKRASRQTATLSGSLQRHLNAYALAASAAGVGALALAQPAEARIVYTPAHRRLPNDQRVSIDLNHDGLADFYVEKYTTGTYRHQIYTTGLNAWATAASNGVDGYLVVGTSSRSAFFSAYALPAGRQVGPKLHFWGRGFMAQRFRAKGENRWHCSGRWNNVRGRYLGLTFVIADSIGQSHYGWARFNESCDTKAPRGKGIKVVLTGYAYETMPNKPIIAGKTKGPDLITLEPGSLGALAAGASRLQRGRN